MMFPKNEPLREDNTNKELIKDLRMFRGELAARIKFIQSEFGEHREGQMVIEKLIEARMWSGNLFGYFDVKDLNAERDKKNNE